MAFVNKLGYLVDLPDTDAIDVPTYNNIDLTQITPSTGQLIYNSDSNEMQFYNGAWTSVGVTFDQNLNTTDDVHVNSITDGTATLTGGDLTGLTQVNSITSGQLSEVANMGAATVSGTQWGYLGAMNQGLATGNNVQFNSVTDGTATLTGGALTGLTQTWGTTASGPEVFYYVDGRVSITGNGSVVSPFKTISEAMTAIGNPVDAYDQLKRFVVDIASGYYDENVATPYFRQLTLVASGPVILGDGALANHVSTTARSLTFNVDTFPTSEITTTPNGRPYISITNSVNSDVSSTHIAYENGFLISGNLLIVSANSVTKELSLFGVKIYGSIDNSGDSGILNVYMKRCYVIGTTTLYNLIEAYSCEFDGLITAHQYGRMIECELDGGITVTNAPSGLLPPTGFYDCELNGTLTGPANTWLWVDISTNYWLNNKGVSIAGGGSKRILGAQDTYLTFQNTSDVTKQARFDLSSITTGNTRVVTIPDSNVDLSNILTPVYGTQYVDSQAGTAVAISDTTNYYFVKPVTGGSASGVTLDNTNGILTIGTTGIYKITISLSFSGGNSNTLDAYAFKNVADTTKSTAKTNALLNIGWTRKLGVGGDVGSTSGCGIVGLTATDTIKFGIHTSVTGINVYNYSIDVFRIA